MLPKPWTNFIFIIYLLLFFLLLAETSFSVAVDSSLMRLACVEFCANSVDWEGVIRYNEWTSYAFCAFKCYLIFIMYDMMWNLHKFPIDK